MITERRKKDNSQTKILLWILLGVAVLGGGWVVFQQVGNSSKSSSATDATTATLPTTRSISKIDTNIFSDERMMGEKLSPGLQFTDQAGITPFDENIPSPPTHIEVRNPGQGRRLVVVWEMPEGETVDGTKVYRMQSEVDLPTLVGTVSADIRVFDDRTVTDGVQYFYIVKTYRQLPGKANVDPQTVESQNVQRYGAVSTDEVPPDPPEAVTVTNIGDGTSVKIAWENPRNDDFSFVRIYRSTVEGQVGDPIAVGNTLIGTSFTDTKLSPGVTYYYTVTAVDLSGNESLGALYGTPGRSNPFLPPTP